MDPSRYAPPVARGGLEAVLACPADGAPIGPCTPAGTFTGTCGHSFARGNHGYLELFVPGDATRDLGTTVEHRVAGQERGESRLYASYLRGWLRGSGATRVLDAGCGPGLTVAAMLDDGLDGYGIDLPGTAERWRELGHDADRFVCGNVTRLPFGDGVFDAVVTIGVVEHVGTTTGHVTLGPGYEALRARFARELLRVTRPGGRVLLSCPNKRFPLDVQHGPNDHETYAPRRTKLFERTGMNLHPVTGAYHLASYRDVGRWFRGHRWTALPLRGYFGFSAFEREGAPRSVARVARSYVESLPGPLRRSALNPYVLVEVEA